MRLLCNLSVIGYIVEMVLNTVKNEDSSDRHSERAGHRIPLDKWVSTVFRMHPEGPHLIIGVYTIKY